MRTFLVSLMVVLVSFGFSAEYAEAKRFGGGSSIGKSFSAPKKQRQAAPTAPTQQKQQATNNATGKADTKKRSGFGGLMAGLLAGGLLGALFFGGAFDGIQFMDILMVLLFAFIGYKLFTMYRKSQQRPPKYATDGAQYELRPERPATNDHAGNAGEGAFGAPQAKQSAPVQPQPEPVQPAPASGLGGAGMQPLKTPEWFNEESFLEGARNHFSILQRAWDNCDWAEIESYTSEEVLAALKEERAKLPEQQTTEIVSVMAEMSNFITEENQVVVSINFYGWLKEDADQTTEFNEIWHLTRDTREENADWMIVGIEQP